MSPWTSLTVYSAKPIPSVVSCTRTSTRGVGLSPNYPDKFPSVKGEFDCPREISGARTSSSRKSSFIRIPLCVLGKCIYGTQALLDIVSTDAAPDHGAAMRAEINEVVEDRATLCCVKKWFNSLKNLR